MSEKKGSLQNLEQPAPTGVGKMEKDDCLLYLNNKTHS